MRSTLPYLLSNDGRLYKPGIKRELEVRMQLFNTKSSLGKRRYLRINQTPAEHLLWRHLRLRRSSGWKFFRQYGIGPYIVDFYCPKLKLVIEADGGQHFSDTGEEYDRERGSFLASMGIRTLRFTNAEILKCLPEVLERINNEIKNS